MANDRLTLVSENRLRELLQLETVLMEELRLLRMFFESCMSVYDLMPEKTKKYMDKIKTMGRMA